jgi:MFS family permease
VVSPGRVLLGASAAQAAVSFVNFGLPAIGPDLRRELDLGLPALGALLSVALLGAGLALIPAGAFVDRVGERAAVLAGTALGVAGLVAAAATQDALALAAALFVSGVGSAVVPVAGAGALFRAYGPGRRGWALGVRQTAVPVGGIAGAVGMPLLVHAWGIGGVLAAAALLVGCSGLWFALVTAREPRRAAHGLAVRRVLRSPGIPRLLLVAACYITVLQALLVYLVPSARAAGLTAFAAGAAYLALNVTAAIARIAWGRVADRGAGRRRVRTLVETGLVAAGGAVLFTAALHLGTAAVLVAAVVFGFGALGWNGIVYLNAGELASAGLAGQAFALAATVVFVLSALATPPLGALADAAGWDALWLTTGAIALLGAWVARGLARPA